MLKKFLLLMFAVSTIALAPSCNHNKIACPAYGDSFPDAKKKKGSTDAPSLPKATKPRSSVLPPGYGKK